MLKVTCPNCEKEQYKVLTLRTCSLACTCLDCGEDLLDFGKVSEFKELMFCVAFMLFLPGMGVLAFNIKMGAIIVLGYLVFVHSLPFKKGNDEPLNKELHKKEPLPADEL